MYISIKALRLIAAAVFAAIIIFNLSLDNSSVPDSTKRKFGNVSFVIILVMITLGSCFGIFNGE